MAAKPSKEKIEAQVIEVRKGKVRYCVLGTTPLILNRMSEKALRQLLFPSPRKNAAEKASSMKHDPLGEYRASPYTLPPGSPALIFVRPEAFKAVIRGAALRMPGVSKTEIGQLTYVTGKAVPVFGLPRLKMDVTRSADINRTPDVRTRACITEWAAFVEVEYIMPLIREQIVTNLFGLGGYTQGIGDWRPEKGAGDFGQFVLVSEDDERFVHITQHHGYAAQLAALERPEFYDEDTQRMYEWFYTEVERRGFDKVLSEKKAVIADQVVDVDAVLAAGAAKKRRGGNGASVRR